MKEYIIVLVLLFALIYGVVSITNISREPRIQACENLGLIYSSRLDMCIDGVRPWESR